MAGIKRGMWVVCLVATIGVLVACGGGTKVRVPPRFDLLEFQTIGMVEFTSNTEGNLNDYASQKFMQAIQSCQPGVRILELGEEKKVLEDLQMDHIDHEAIRAMGEKYNIDAVIIGQMEVTDVKPKVELSSILSSMSVQADVEASLSVRLMETSSGATMWTNSARQKQTVAHVGISSNSPVNFGADDPENAYGKLVNGLVYWTTQDFRAKWVKQ